MNNTRLNRGWSEPRALVFSRRKQPVVLELSLIKHLQIHSRSFFLFSLNHHPGSTSTEPLEWHPWKWTARLPLTAPGSAQKMFSSCFNPFQLVLGRIHEHKVSTTCSACRGLNKTISESPCFYVVTVLLWGTEYLFPWLYSNWQQHMNYLHYNWFSLLVSLATAEQLLLVLAEGEGYCLFDV